MWNGLLALVTLVLYSVAVAALVLMALFYTRSEGCMYNKVLIGVNGGLCLFVSLVAISPCVQNRESADLFLLVFGYFCGCVPWGISYVLGRKTDSSELVLLLSLSPYLQFEVLLLIKLAARCEMLWVCHQPLTLKEHSNADVWWCVGEFAQLLQQ